MQGTEALHRFNISDFAREAGLQRTSIYRAFGDEQQLPHFSTVLRVLTAMGLEIRVVPRRPASDGESTQTDGLDKREK
ncbi:DNA-binding protein (plasmid) [Bradyrhizobium lupini]|uniref:helix-turn-helix domain-containing transcriptional regulator n=1 Tax=Rhizobium lupini TaxID=136996 RepID=UPI0036718CC4